MDTAVGSYIEAYGTGLFAQQLLDQLQHVPLGLPIEEHFPVYKIIQIAFELKPEEIGLKSERPADLRAYKQSYYAVPETVSDPTLVPDQP